MDNKKMEAQPPSSSSAAATTKTVNSSVDSKDQTKKKEATKTVPFFKLFAFSDTIDKSLMIIGTIGAIGNGLSLPLMAIIFGELTDSFGETENFHEVVLVVSTVCLKFVYLAAGACVAAFLQVGCWMISGERQGARIRSLYLKTILRQEISFFDKEINTGEIVDNMSGDTLLVQDAIGEKVGKFLQLLSTFVGGYVVAFYKGWLLTLVLLSVIPLLVISGGVMSMVISKMASSSRNAYAKAATVVEQTIGSIRTVASFTGEKEACGKYDEALVKAYRSDVREGLVSGLGIGSVMLILYCSFGVTIWFGAKLVVENKMTGGDVLSVLIAQILGSMSLGQASPCITAFAAGQAAAYKIFETIKRKPTIDAYDSNGKILDDIQGDIELRDVYFAYPTRPDEPILSGFSLSIQKGKTSALVGHSGSGKSTIISLIERFYDPQSGEVVIDGINIKDFQLKWIRDKISLVSQEPVLFTGTIKDNIAYGKTGATIQEIRAVVELANAAKFIDTFPKGLDTMVGDHGTQLSGGQKQRIAIARAILKDPRILLLDEATSALDVESERSVQEALDRIMINRTTLVIAHRLTTIRNADFIAVIDHGKVVETGNHSELIKDSEGAYSKLIRLQEVHKGKDENIDEEEDKLPDTPMTDESSRRSTGRMSSTPHSTTPGKNVNININKPPPTPAVPIILRLASLNKPEIPFIALGTIFAAINGAIQPIFGLIFASMINSFYETPHQLKRDSRFWALMFVTIGVVSLVVYPGRAYFFGVAGNKLIKRVRFLCFEKVIHMEIGWFDQVENSSGIIGAKLSTDATSLRALVGDSLAQMVQDASSVITGLIIAFEASWQLSLIILAIIPIIGLYGIAQSKFYKGFSADDKTMYEEASQVANDAVGSIRTIASFCAEDKVMDLYKTKCEKPTRRGIKRGLISGIGFGTSSALLFLTYAPSFYAGARLVGAGKATFSDVVRVFFALTMAAMAITQSNYMGPEPSKAKAAAASIFSILDRKTTIDPSDDSGMKLENVKGEIQFRHVKFSYPARPDAIIFKDLCLSIHSGKTVALVGESGTGKSTVISLLQRFYDPQSGQIIVDGIEIKKLQVKWLRRQMGLVSQEPVLFNDTIRANIAYGKEGNATEAEITEAAELANAHKFISALQQGYNTLVGERGIQLSGGQKQRIAIARAIVKSPKILLLDEATSALDAESEKTVQEALDRVMENRTTIIVAHRLSTIMGVNMIAVMKNGVIVEKGKHETLVNIEDGVYASLVTLPKTTST